MAAALVAVIAYNAVAVELVAGLGYFGQLVVQQQTGINLPWELYAAVGVALAGLLGYRTIDIGARLLAVPMIAEIAIARADSGRSRRLGDFSRADGQRS